MEHNQARYEEVKWRLTMIKTNLGVTIAVLVVSIAAMTVLNLALSESRETKAINGVSAETTASIPK